MKIAMMTLVILGLTVQFAHAQYVPQPYNPPIDVIGGQTLGNP